MFMHVSIVQLNARVTVWNMCGIPYVCVHVYLLYITLMHVSTSSRVSLPMTGNSHKCVIMGTLHKFMGFLRRHLAEDTSFLSFLLMRGPCPKAESIGAEETSECRQVSEQVSEIVGPKS